MRIADPRDGPLTARKWVSEPDPSPLARSSARPQPARRPGPTRPQRTHLHRRRPRHPRPIQRTNSHLGDARRHLVTSAAPHAWEDIPARPYRITRQEQRHLLAPGERQHTAQLLNCQPWQIGPCADCGAPSTAKTVSYMAVRSLGWVWGVDGGDGLFRTGCGRWPGRCCRLRGCVRRVVGSRTSMMRRSSLRSSTCWSAGVPGGRCRRVSGRRSRRCIVGSSSGPGRESGAGCTTTSSSSWTSGAWSTCPGRSWTPPTFALKKGRTYRSEPRGPG